MCAMTESRMAGSSTPTKTTMDSASTATALSCAPLPAVEALSKTGCASSSSLRDNMSNNNEAVYLGRYHTSLEMSSNAAPDYYRHHDVLW